MAIDTIKNDEIFIDGIQGYGFHRTQKLTKQILVGIISRYFSRHHKSYQLALPSLSEFGDESGNSLLHILEEFPYQERKVPSIIITNSDAKEQKRYIGTDNTVATLRTGEKAYQQYAGASAMLTTLVVIAESPDVRMELASLLHVCFTHYHRWHYFFIVHC